MKSNVDYSLYLVTNSNNKTKEEFLKIIEESIRGGVSIVQIREKKIDAKDFYEFGIEIKKLTNKYNVPLIVNDRVDLAIAINADGVHIGQTDIPTKAVRKMIGNEKILGVSAATIETAKAAEREGADYIGSGAIFPTKTKNASCISIDYLKKIINSVNIPIVVIGGLDENNIDKLANTGIKGISMVSTIMNSDNPEKMCRNLKNKIKLLID